MNELKHKPRITIELTKELKIDIKMRATKRGISMKLYILRAILECIKREKQYE